MKDKPTSQELRELLWRRPLTEAERARATSEPHWRADLELEARLTEALLHLPKATVSTNFTARVMEAIDREDAEAQRSGWQWSWTRWLPRVAIATAAIVFAGLSWQQHEITQRRSALAQSLGQVASATTLPGVDALNNYDAIQRMSQAQPADDALLALMQ